MNLSHLKLALVISSFGNSYSCHDLLLQLWQCDKYNVVSVGQLYMLNADHSSLYSSSLSSGSDVSTQTQLLSVYTHSLFLREREPVCAIFLGARDLALHLANKRTTSLPVDGELEYIVQRCQVKDHISRGISKSVHIA